MLIQELFQNCKKKAHLNAFLAQKIETRVVVTAVNTIAIAIPVARDTWASATS